MLKILSRVPVKKTAVRQFVFGRAAIKHEGLYRLGVRFRDRFVGAKSNAVNSKGLILLGLQTSLELDLITLK